MAVISLQWSCLYVITYHLTPTYLGRCCLSILPVLSQGAASSAAQREGYADVKSIDKQHPRDDDDEDDDDSLAVKRSRSDGLSFHTFLNCPIVTLYVHTYLDPRAENVAPKVIMLILTRFRSEN